MANTSPVQAATTADRVLNGDLQSVSQAPQKVDRLLTIHEVAEWLGVSKGWVYDHVTRKRPFLPCVRFGEITRFRREEIQNFIQKHANRRDTS